MDKELPVNYRQIKFHDLEVQLTMFRRKHAISKLSEAIGVIRNMSTDARRMLEDIERLIRLLLVYPCSSIEAERSFSSPRP